MEETLNKAISMGWRFKTVGLGNTRLALVPPDLDDTEGYETKTLKVAQLYVPMRDIEEWIEKHTVTSPDEKKRDELKAKVVNWLGQQWPSYIRDCDGDEMWAYEIIIDDAHSDFGADKADIKDWLDAIS